MHRIEDIELRLQLHPEDGEKRVDALNDLSHSVQTIDVKRAFQLAEEAISIAERIGYLYGLAKAFIMRAQCHWRTSNYKNGMDEAFTALRLFEQIEEISGQSIAYNTLGLIYRNLGNYSQALDYHNKALKLDVEINNNPSKSVTLNNIGVIYQRMADYTRALAFLHQSLNLCEKTQDQWNSALTMTNIGIVHSDLGDYHQSIRFHRRSITIYESMKNAWGEATSLQHLGMVTAKMGDLDDALVFHRRSLALRQEIKDIVGQAQSFFHIGEIFNRKGNDTQAINFYKHSLSLRQEVNDRYGEAEIYLGYGTIYLNPDSAAHNTIIAIEHFNKSLRIATDLQAKQLMYRAHELLAQAYKQIQLHQKALEHFERFYALRIEVGGDHVANRVKQLEVQLATEKAEGEAEIHRLKSVELADALEKVAALNQNLMQLDKEKNEFLSIVSHDLKNPIASILLTASTAERYYERMSADDLKQHLRQISDTATRMKDIVHKLLDMNAIESGAISMTITQVNLSALIHSVMKEYKTRALAKSIRLIFETTGEDTFVFADAHSLHECLENLLSNAIKYSPMGKHITARIHNAPVSGYRRMEISDEGPGISAEDQAKLFSRFGKVKSKTTGGESSNGLGLSIVKKFIEAMNGKVGVESQPGKGSTFFVELPAASSPRSRAIHSMQLEKKEE